MTRLARFYPSSLVETFNRPTAPPVRLGLFRAIVGLYVFHDLWITRHAISGLRSAGPEHWSPAGLMQLVADGVPDAWMVSLGLYATLGFFALWILGLGWRFVGPIAALSLLLLWSYRLSWGMVYHNFHLPALHVLILGFMPSAAAFSIDSAVGGRWQRWAGWSPEGGAEWAGRTLQIAALIGAWTYLIAGVAKVRANLGWSWIDGHNLLDQIGYDALFKDLLSNGGSPIVPWLYAHPTVLGPMAATALGLELLAPLALLHPRLGQGWALGTWCMHLGIGWMMDIWFWYPTYFVAFLPFFPLEVVADRTRALAGRAVAQLLGRR